MEKVLASMSGTVWKIEVKENDDIKAGDVVVILESMKMEIPIESTCAGTVVELNKAEGEFVQEGDVLMSIKNN